MIIFSASTGWFTATFLGKAAIAALLEKGAVACIAKCLILVGLL